MLKNVFSPILFFFFFTGIFLIPIPTQAIDCAYENISDTCISYRENSLKAGYCATEQIFTSLASQAQDAVTEFDFRDAFSSFGISETPGKDIYLKIYRQFQNKPYGDTIKTMAIRYGFPEKDIEGILAGDLTTFSLENEGRGLTIPEAQSKQSEFQRVFSEELEFQQYQNDIALSLYSSEIFSNGDLEDSGFDLIEDLNKIEEVLFGKRTPQNFLDYDALQALSEGLSLLQDDDDSGTSSKDSEPSVFTGDQSSQTAGASQSDPVNASESDDTSQTDDDVSIDGSTDSSSQSQDGSNQNSSLSSDGDFLSSDDALESLSGSTFCTDQEDLELTQLAENESENSTQDGLTDSSDISSQNTSSTTNSSQSESKSSDETADSSAASETSSQNDSSSVSSDSLSANIIDTGYTNSDGAEIFIPSSPDWPKSSSLCAGTFCLEITTGNNAGKTRYPDNDRCIACNVDFINKHLYDTISHNLVPSKITGNIFETPVCKEVLGLKIPPKDMGGIIQFFSKPIRTPVHDDIVTKMDFEDAVFEAFDKILSSPPSDPLGVGSALSFDKHGPVYYLKYCNEEAVTEEQKELCAQVLTNKATELALTNNSQESTYEEVLSDIDRIIAEAEKNAQNEARTQKNETKLENASLFYQYLIEEMDQMQTYFSVYFDMLGKIQTDATDKLCEKRDAADPS